MLTMLLGFAFVASAGDNADGGVGVDDNGLSATNGGGQAKAKTDWTMGILPEVPEDGSGAALLPRQQYRIGLSDELAVEVFQAPELSGVERVNARGYINLPLIGQVLVAGLTEEEAENRIAELLEKDYLQNPHVNIDINDQVSQHVSILGSVKSPGVYPLKGPATLLQALAFAGGPVSIANEKNIIVFRANSAGEIVGYVVNLTDIYAGKKKDPKVIGNDRIVVPESGSRAAIQSITGTLRGFVGFGTL